ncbi:hypothetical protein [Flavimaricola marinus]|uniref:Mannitol-1-phosphate 5-dehydrogenase n=1 Tax=Flavimaricola marinus TaxID=1819565 RepID=A0A238LLE6_9RHOB|nr:hypothetical protein [Flavimaricola marinus]SMY09776.1 Mannitol-1-phosphate 5-dehydrogenase [Flavimaricola marinus]
MTHLHFGAGALGRGLVLPRIVSAGGDVEVADTDAALISRLRRDEGYTLEIVGDEGCWTEFIPIRAAHLIGEDTVDLGKAIEDADVVTTSVQVGNLTGVVDRLAPVWQRGPERARVIVGCENLHNVGAHIAGLFDRAGGVAGLKCPDCVVDRICATSADGATIETEDYSEWVVDGDMDLRGPDRVANVDGLFFRKRYLVNTLADSCAFVGQSRGFGYLYAAVSDPKVRDTVAPLIDMLCKHLVDRFDYSLQEIVEYRDKSIARLSLSGISRRIETVARDPWRKFAPDERFLEPMVAYRAAGGDINEALSALAAILRGIEPDPEILSERLTKLWAGTQAAPLVEQVVETVR